MAIRFFHPRHNDFEGFLYQILSVTLLSYLYSSERASISLLKVECQTMELLVSFITSLVWRGPWLGIELEASTQPLGYRGGGVLALMLYFICTRTRNYILFFDKTRLTMFYFLNNINLLPETRTYASQATWILVSVQVLQFGILFLNSLKLIFLWNISNLYIWDGTHYLYKS